jgi:hypothetical protein
MNAMNPSRHCALLCFLAVGILGSCASNEEVSGTLDTPAPIAVLEPTTGGPFDEAVGFVADRHGGRIRVLALGRGRYLSDDPFASFFRGSSLATGSDRLLSGVVAYAPDADHTTVFAIDKRFGQLLAVPHVTGRDVNGYPKEYKTQLKRAEFVDVDGSGDSVTVDSILVSDGYATTETWTMTFDRGRWSVRGSRSGLQQHRAYAGSPYQANDGAISFVIRGEATQGDQVLIETDAGIEEYDLGATPIAISMAPDQSRAAIVTDTGSLAQVVWLDPATRTLSAPIEIPPESTLGRMAWTADSGHLFIAGGQASQVIEIEPGEVDTVTIHAMPFPVHDVAPLFDDTDQTLFIARSDLAEVWLYDVTGQSMIDINRATPGTDGMRFRSAVRGIAALPTAYDWPETENNVPRSGRSVAVSLYEGKLVWMEEGTGCLVRDVLGPRSEIRNQSSISSDFTTLNFSVGTTETAFLEPIANSQRHINVNTCGGIARSEGWSLRYDRLVQGWHVENELGGEQSTIAYEDQRYLTDEAEISFVLRAGRVPSEDGWGIRFDIEDGVLTADGNNDDGDGIRDFTFDMPSDPAVFHHERDGVLRPFIAVAAESADIVLMIDPADGFIDGVWD